MKKAISADDMRQTLIDLGVQVHQADLHGISRGVTRKLNDGYLILVERSLSFDVMLETIKHELCHILLGHLEEYDKTEQEMEMEVRESAAIYIVDHGECHKKIYSVN